MRRVFTTMLQVSMYIELNYLRGQRSTDKKHAICYPNLTKDEPPPHCQRQYKVIVIASYAVRMQSSVVIPPCQELPH